MLTNKDLEKKVKILDKKDQKIQKEVQALEKKVVLFNGGGGQDEEGLSVVRCLEYELDCHTARGPEHDHKEHQHDPEHLSSRQRAAPHADSRYKRGAADAE